MEYEKEYSGQFEKPIRTPEARLRYRLVGELTILSALVFGGVFATTRDKSGFVEPYVVSECDKSKSRVNYNDKSTWCIPQKVL